MANSQGLDFKYRISGNNAVVSSLKTIQSRVSDLAKGMGSLAASSARAASGIGAIGARAAGTVGKIGAATAALGALFAASRAGNFAQGIIDADVNLSQLRISLEQAAGSSQLAEKELEFLRQTARKFGVEISEVAQPYSQFANAIVASGGSLDLARNAFLGVTQAGLGLGATSEQISRVLRQLQQAASKNKITMEDLGTVAESLPGALGLLSQSLGITTKELAELTASGSLEAVPALDKFGKFLQQRFAGAALKAAQDVQSSQARFRNAFLETRQQIAEGGFADAMQSAFDRVTASIEAMNASGSASRLGSFLASGLNRAADAAFNLVKRLSALLRNEQVLANIATAGRIIRIVFNGLGNIIRGFFAGFSGSEGTGNAIASVLALLQRLAIAANSLSRSSIWRTLGGLARSVFNLFGSAISTALNSFLRIIAAFKTGGSTFNPFLDLIVSVLNVFRQLIPLVRSAFGSITSSVSASSGVLQNFAGFLANVFNQFAKILETFNGRNSGLGDNFIAPGISERAKTIVDLISRGVDIAKAFGPVISAAFVSGVSIVRGFIPVLSSAFQQVGQIITDVFANIDIKSILADIALLFSGASASQAANAGLEPLFQIRDVIGQLFAGLKAVLPIVIAIAGSLLAGFLAVFNILNNQVRPVLDGIAQALGFDSFIAVVAQVKVFLILLNGVAAIGSGIAATFGAIGKAVGFVLTIFGRLQLVATILRAAFFAIASIIGVSAGTLLAIVGVVVAIGAAVFLIYKYWDEIVAFLGQIFTFIGQIVSAILNGLGAAIQSIPGLFVAAFNAVLQFLANWSLPAILLRLFEAIFPGITQGLINAFSSAIDSIRNFFSGLWDWIDRVIFGNFSTAWQKLKSFFGFGSSSNSPANDNTPRFAKGGSVWGKGSGTSDSILAWLSNGEYVINAAAARAFRPLLDMINYGGSGLKSKLKNGLPAFANGGLVSMPRIQMPAINMGGAGFDWSSMSQVHGNVDGRPYLPGVPLFSPAPAKVIEEGFRQMNRGRVRRGAVRG